MNQARFTRYHHHLGGVERARAAAARVRAEQERVQVVFRRKTAWLNVALLCAVGASALVSLAGVLPSARPFRPIVAELHWAVQLVMLGLIALLAIMWWRWRSALRAVTR